MRRWEGDRAARRRMADLCRQVAKLKPAPFTPQEPNRPGVVRAAQRVLIANHTLPWQMWQQHGAIILTASTPNQYLQVACVGKDTVRVFMGPDLRVFLQCSPKGFFE